MKNESTTTGDISILNVPLGKNGKKLINAALKKRMDLFKNFYKALDESPSHFQLKQNGYEIREIPDYRKSINDQNTTLFEITWTKIGGHNRKIIGKARKVTTAWKIAQSHYTRGYK